MDEFEGKGKFGLDLHTTHTLATQNGLRKAFPRQ